VFVIDSKHYRGRLRQAADGSWWHGRYPLAPALRAAQFEADRADALLGAPRVPVLPLVVVHGASVPWGELVADGVPVVAAKRLVPVLRGLPPILPTERVAALADRARLAFHAAA
jgi:hypothetical protein